MKKLNKLVLNKSKALTAPEMKKISGGEYVPGCYYRYPPYYGDCAQYHSAGPEDVPPYMLAYGWCCGPDCDNVSWARDC
jgi:hypothetical protein